MEQGRHEEAGWRGTTGWSRCWPTGWSTSRPGRCGPAGWCWSGASGSRPCSTRAGPSPRARPRPPRPAPPRLAGELQGSGIPAVDRSAAQEALSGVANARATVLAGFTTVRDVGTFRAFVDVALRDAIRDGTVLGPRMAVAGAYVTVPGGGGAVTGLAPD